MCRNIRTLANLEHPATKAEIRASSLQFVRGGAAPTSGRSELSGSPRYFNSGEPLDTRRP